MTISIPFLSQRGTNMFPSKSHAFQLSFEFHRYGESEGAIQITQTSPEVYVRVVYVVEFALT